MIMMTNIKSSEKNVAAWLASSGRAYSGYSSSKTFAATIVSGDTDLGRQTLLNSLLTDFLARSRKKNKVVSVRDSSYIHGSIDEKVIVSDLVDSDTVSKMFHFKPNVIIFDSTYDEHAFDVLACPHFYGVKVFYVIKSSGDTVSELRDNTVQGYLTSIRQNNLEGVNKLMVSRVYDLDAEDPFGVTEFAVKRNV
jgi:hypothetical protein